VMIFEFWGALRSAAVGAHEMDCGLLVVGLGLHVLIYGIQRVVGGQTFGPRISATSCPALTLLLA